MLNMNTVKVPYKCLKDIENKLTISGQNTKKECIVILERYLYGKPTKESGIVVDKSYLKELINYLSISGMNSKKYVRDEIHTILKDYKEKQDYCR